MADIYLVRMLTRSGTVLEAYFKAEVTADTLYANIKKEMKAVQKAVSAGAELVYRPFTFEDGFGVSQTVDMSEIMVAVLTDSDASARTAKDLDTANRAAQARFSVGMNETGFRPGPNLTRYSQ